MPPHQSDSAVQRDAEQAIVQSLAEQLGVVLEGGKAITLSGGARIQVDAQSDDAKVVVEAYARQGRLKGGQLKKIAQDVLKLALLRREPEFADVTPIIVFASEDARASVTGWVKSAAEVFGVEMRVVEIAPQLRATILATQAAQKMVNVELPIVVDDLVIE